jgi:hypothetical protein
LGVPRRATPLFGHHHARKTGNAKFLPSSRNRYILLEKSDRLYQMRRNDGKVPGNSERNGAEQRFRENSKEINQ